MLFVLFLCLFFVYFMYCSWYFIPQLKSRSRAWFSRARALLSLWLFNVCSFVFVLFRYISTPLLGGSTGGLHRFLLDLPVLTDTSNVVSYSANVVSLLGVKGFKGSPTVPITCDVCGLPLKSCVCIPGVDY